MTHTAKSAPREMELMEAYTVIKQYRKQLHQLKQVDMIMHPHELLAITHELRQLDAWIRNQEKVIQIQIEVEV
jgi:hypothetical protein